ncbi:hypothetical protein LCGC14_1889260 [marine sediment metagenome]|uniref:Uncharacterized protein n=1 Tax=marine sediment metagenome TaxID=412755 RepID=A0A0F9IDV1_9ZZZZ
MAAKKLSTEFPQFVLRGVTSFVEVYNRLRGLIAAFNDLRNQMISSVNDHGDRLTATTGAGAPATTPADTLLYYLDTSAKDMYVSVGTSSSADWKKVTP